ncbi:ribonuclease H-like protein, partial [Macrolepiota fuliginosa MF-IS2]
VFVDGACRGNGRPWARAGMGIYFGPRSYHNFYQRLEGHQTNQRAEINAAILALRKVQDLVEDERLDAKTVVLASDSMYVVKAMTEWIVKWRGNGWLNVRGGRVENWSDLQELDRLIDELRDENGVYVKLWHVDREYNEGADKLA